MLHCSYVCRHILAGACVQKTCTPDVQVVMQDAHGQQQPQEAMMAGMGHYLPPPAAFPLMLVGQHCFGAGLTPNGHIPLLVQLVCGHTLQGGTPASQHALVFTFSVLHDWGATLDLSNCRLPDNQASTTVNSNHLTGSSLDLRRQ